MRPPTIDDQTKNILNAISQTIKIICCNGSTNTGEALNLLKSLSAALKGTGTTARLYHTNELLPAIKDSVCAGVEHMLGKKIDQATVLLSDRTSILYNPACISYFLKQLSSEPISSDGLESIINLRKKLPADKETLKPIFAHLSYQWITQVVKFGQFLKPYEDIIKTGSNFILVKKEEPKNREDRLKTMQYLAKDVEHCAYFGTGNCSIMAELAFLLAIQRIEKQPIRYIRFCHKTKNTEELNALVIGPWPQKGCMIIAPWLKLKPVFEWKGNYKDTYFISTMHYNHHQVLFSVTSEQARQFWNTKLNDWGFDPNKLLLSPNRKNYLQYVSNQVEAALPSTNSPGLTS